MEEVLFGRIRMTIPDAQFRVSTDSMVLADFCRDAGGRGLDLGCGCGTLGLLLLGSGAAGSVCGIEIQPEAARQAEENARRNGLADRFSVVCGDLRQAHAQIPAGSFDFAVSNPPYYPPGSGRLRKEDSLSLARSELCCPLDALCAAAARALRWGGRLYLVHKPERLTDVLCALREAGIEPKRLRFVHNRAEYAPSLFLLEGCRGGKPGPGPWHGSAAASGKARFPDAGTGAAGAGSPHGQRRRPPLLRACRFPAGRREAPRVFRKRNLLRCGDHEHPPGGVRPVTRFSSNAYSTPSLVFRLSPFRGMAFFRPESRLREAVLTFRPKIG